MPSQTLFRLVAAVLTLATPVAAQAKPAELPPASFVAMQGKHLGEVGSRIVCTTIIGQIKADTGSYLNRSGPAWTPADGVTLPSGGVVNSIKTFLEFAGVQI